MARALKIRFNVTTGERSGGINPRDPKLRARGAAWQFINDADPTQCYEIREVLDDRDLSQYEGVDGVTILPDVMRINAALAQLERDRRPEYTFDEVVVYGELQVRGQLSRLSGKRIQDIAADLHAEGFPGVSKSTRTVPRVAGG